MAIEHERPPDTIALNRQQARGLQRRMDRDLDRLLKSQTRQWEEFCRMVNNLPLWKRKQPCKLKICGLILLGWLK